MFILCLLYVNYVYICLFCLLLLIIIYVLKYMFINCLFFMYGIINLYINWFGVYGYGYREVGILDYLWGGEIRYFNLLIGINF